MNKQVEKVREEIAKKIRLRFEHRDAAGNLVSWLQEGLPEELADDILAIPNLAILDKIQVVPENPIIPEDGYMLAWQVAEDMREKIKAGFRKVLEVKE